MNVVDLHKAGSGFRVLQTTALSQTAIMTLQPGGQSSGKPNIHERSDQILLVLEGEILAEVAEEKRQLSPGEVCLVPAGTPHRFENVGAKPALAFSVYSPPEYSPGEKD